MEIPSDESHRESVVKNANIAYVLRPVYYLSRIYGFHPFSLVFDSNGDVFGATVGKLDCLWFAVSLLIYVSFSLLECRNLRLPSTVITFMDNILFMLNVVFAMICILMDLFNRFKFANILKQFTIFDAEASSNIL